MKTLTIGVLIATLVGCASSTPHQETKNVDDWFSLGENRAKNGFLIQSENQLIESYANDEVTTQFYNAYLQGHESGVKAYCAQNPYILGLSEEPYFGLCDQDNFNFADEYQKGINHKKN